MSSPINSKMKKEDLIKILKAKEKERSMLFAKQSQNNKVMEQLGWLAKKMVTIEEKIDQLNREKNKINQSNELNLSNNPLEYERPKSPNPLTQSQIELSTTDLLPSDAEDMREVKSA